MLRNTIIILTLTATLLISGCSIRPLKYGPSEGGGPGYFEKQRDVYKWMVGTYYHLSNHTPQQAANILMQRSAEIGRENGFTWMRMLNKKSEERLWKRRMPGVIDLKGGAIYPGSVYEVNIDENVSDNQFRQGVNDALVEYFEYAYTIDCTLEKCGTLGFMIESCSTGGDGGAKELIEMCGSSPVANIYGDYKRCVDSLRFQTKDTCKHVMAAAYDVHGFIEERKIGGTGSWFKVEDIISKYKERSQQWQAKSRSRHNP